MALNLVNIGAAAGDGTGDPARTAFGKVNAAIASVSSQVYNVRDYGAIGDGVADDRAAIQAAINAASAAGGGTVFLPPGTYALATKNTVSGKHALTVHSNTRILGSGIGSTTVVARADLVQDTPLIDLLNVSRVEIAHFTIDGNNARFAGGGHTPEDEGIHSSGSSDLWFHHLRITRTGQDAIDCDNCDRILITDCILEDNWGCGVHLIGGVTATNDATVKGCIFRNNALDRILIAGAVGDDAAALDSRGARVTVIGCVFTGNARGVTFHNGAGRVLSGCVIIQPVDRVGVWLRAESSYTLIQGCYISAEGASGRGILMDSATRATIAGNRIRCVGTRGIDITSGANITVSGNSFTGSKVFNCRAIQVNSVMDQPASIPGRISITNNTAESVGWGLHILAGRGNISGNHIHETSEQGIDIRTTATTAWHVTGNHATVPGDKFGIRLLDNPTNIVIAANDLTISTTGTGHRIDHTGPGTPEGVIHAAIGSIWRRTDGGAGTALYIKESGTGNTGWVAK
jgi:parallel beta-helix repeat protein